MIRRFFSYYRPHRRLFIIDFTSAVIVAILELAYPVAVQWFIDQLLPSGDWSMIVTVSVLLLLRVHFKHFFTIHRWLSGPHVRDQYRNRYAARTVLSRAKAVFSLF